MPPSGGDSPSGARCAIPIITRVAQHNSLPPSPTNIRLSNDHYHSSSEASRLTSSRVLRASQPPASHQGSYHIPSPSDHSSYDGNPRNASSFPQSTLEPQTYGRSQHSRFPAFSSLSPLDPNPTAGPSHNTLTDGTPRAVGLKRKPSRSLSPKPIEARRNSAALDYSDRQPTSDPSQNLSSKSRHMSPASLQHSPAQVSRYSYDRSLGSHSYHPMHPSAHTFNDRVSQGRETSAPSSLSNLLSSEQPIQRYLAEQQEASDPSRMLSREYSRPALAPEFIHGRGWLPSGAMLSDRKNYMLGTPVQNISQPGPRPSSAQDWALYHRSSVSASPQMTRNFALPEKDYPAIREHSSLGCPLSPDSTLHHPQSPDHARGQVSPCPISETSHTLANDIQPQHSRISPVEHRHPHPYPYPSHSYPNHKPAYNCSDSVTSLPPQTSIQPVSSSNERNPSPISSSFRLKFDTHRPYCPPGSHSPTVETNLPRSTIRRTHGSTELLTSNPSHVHLQQSHPYLERSLPASPLSHHTRHDLNLKVNVAHVDRAHMYQQDSRQVFNSSQDLTTHISPREWTMGLYPPSSTAEKSLPQAPFSLANSNSRPIAHYSPKFEHSSKPILSVDQHFSGSPSQVTHFSDQSPHLSHRKPSPGHVFANEENTEEHFFQSNQTSQSQISCQQENSQALTSLQNSSSRELPSNLKQYKRFKLPISNEQDPPTCKESREDKASIRGAPSLLAGNHLKHYNYSHSHPGECPGQLEVLPAENPMQQSLNTALKNTSENSIHTNVVSFSHLENTSGSPQGMLKLSSSHQYQINEELFQEKEKDIEESFTGEFAKEAKKIFLPPKRLCYSEVSERVACSAIDTSGNVYISSPTSRQGSPVITLSCDIKSCDSEAQIQHFPETNLLTSKETNQLKSPEPSQKGTNKLGCSSDYVSLAPEGPRISPQDGTCSSSSALHFTQVNSDTLESTKFAEPDSGCSNRASCEQLGLASIEELSATHDDVVDDVTDDGIIRCICSVTTDDGFTIQCETCEVWQHAVCVKVPYDKVPEHYFCDRCDPSPTRRKQLADMAPQAEIIQQQRLKREGDASLNDQNEDDSDSTPERDLLGRGTRCASEDDENAMRESPILGIVKSHLSSETHTSEQLRSDINVHSPNLKSSKNRPPELLPPEMLEKHTHGNTRKSCKRTSMPSGSVEQFPTSSKNDVLFSDNGLGLSGIPEATIDIDPSTASDTASVVPKEGPGRKAGRKPHKTHQAKQITTKQPSEVLAATTVNQLPEHESLPIVADADDRYEAWRFEYTPTANDLYTDPAAKKFVGRLTTNYMKHYCLSDDDPEAGESLDLSTEPESASELNMKFSAQISNLAASPTSPGILPLQPVGPSCLNISDPVPRNQRANLHAFGRSRFLPVMMEEIPPATRLTIKAVPPSSINFAPTLSTNPFCPTFSNPASNSTTSSLPRLITHGVFSAQSISRGSFIANLKGSIMLLSRYTHDVFNQYEKLGCNKPFVKFFKSTRLSNKSPEEVSDEPEDGLVIDSRQYGNEMRFIRNGCHPNAFINLIITPSSSSRHDGENRDKSLGPQDGQSNFRLTGGDPSGEFEDMKFLREGMGHQTSGKSPLKLDDISNKSLHLPWDVSFGVFAAHDISRREEIILPWEWDDRHSIHLLPRLLLHSNMFEIQQQLKSPSLPSTRVQFLPWSSTDLKLLSCKMASIALTIFGLTFCGCERKRSCGINLMWKIGCLSAGQPMFPNTAFGEQADISNNFGEVVSMSSLKEKQDANKELTFEEKFRVVLNSFLEQPNQGISKTGRNVVYNFNVSNVNRLKKHKIDLGPLLCLKKDWWLYSPDQRSDLEGWNVTMGPRKMMAANQKKLKRVRSRSIFSSTTTASNKVRRVSDPSEVSKSQYTRDLEPEVDFEKKKCDKEADNEELAYISERNDEKNESHDRQNEAPNMEQLQELDYHVATQPGHSESIKKESSFGPSQSAIHVNRSEPFLSSSFPLSLPLDKPADVTNDSLSVPEGQTSEHLSPVLQADFKESVSVPTKQSVRLMNDENDASSFPQSLLSGNLLEGCPRGMAIEAPHIQEVETCKLRTCAPASYSSTISLVSVSEVQAVRFKDSFQEDSINESLSVASCVTDALVLQTEVAQQSQPPTILSAHPDLAQPKVSFENVLALHESDAKASEESWLESSGAVIKPDLTINNSEVQCQEMPLEEFNADTDIPTTESQKKAVGNVLEELVAEFTHSKQEISHSGNVAADLNSQDLGGSQKSAPLTPQGPMFSSKHELEKNEELMEPLSVPADDEAFDDCTKIEPNRLSSSALQISDGEEDHRSGLCDSVDYMDKKAEYLKESEIYHEESDLSERSFDETDEDLLDSDASTTILDSSDEEMLSSHTNRYLLNRKRNKGKRLLRPPRLDLSSKNIKPLASREVEQRSQPSPARLKNNGRVSGSTSPADEEHVATDKICSNYTATRFEFGEDHVEGRGDKQEIDDGDENKQGGKKDGDDEDEDDGPRFFSSMLAVKELGAAKQKRTIQSSSPSDIELQETEVDIFQLPQKVSSSPSISHTSAVGNQQCSSGLMHQGVVNSQLLNFGSLACISPKTDSRSTPHVDQIESDSSREQGVIPDSMDSDTVQENPVNFHLTAEPTNTICNDAVATTEAQAVSEAIIAQTCDANADTSLDDSPSPVIKAPPKRISLRDYRSRKVNESVAVAPVINPLMRFSTPLHRTLETERSNKPRAPPSIIPSLPPLLPPTSQPLPLLPLSPRKLELVSSVLSSKKDEKLNKDEEEFEKGVGEDKALKGFKHEKDKLSNYSSSQIQAQPESNRKVSREGEPCNTSFTNDTQLLVEVKSEGKKIADSQPAHPFIEHGDCGQLPSVSNQVQESYIVKLETGASEDSIAKGEGNISEQYLEDDIDGVAIECVFTPSDIDDMEPAEGLLPFRGEEVVGSPEKHRSHLAVTSQPQYEPEKFQNCSNTDKTHIGVAVLSSHFQPESEERKLSFERLRNKSELEEKRPGESVDACLLNSNLSKADNGYLSEAQPTPGRSAEPCISVFTNKHTVSPLRSKSSDVEMRKEGSPTSFSDPIGKEAGSAINSNAILDFRDSPTSAPRPRLSLAAYRKRLAASRPLKQEELSIAKSSLVLTEGDDDENENEVTEGKSSSAGRVTVTNISPTKEISSISRFTESTVGENVNDVKNCDESVALELSQTSKDNCLEFQSLSSVDQPSTVLCTNLSAKVNSDPNEQSQSSSKRLIYLSPVSTTILLDEKHEKAAKSPSPNLTSHLELGKTAPDEMADKVVETPIGIRRRRSRTPAEPYPASPHESESEKPLKKTLQPPQPTDEKDIVKVLGGDGPQAEPSWRPKEIGTELKIKKQMPLLSISGAPNLTTSKVNPSYINFESRSDSSHLPMAPNPLNSSQTPGLKPTNKFNVELGGGHSRPMHSASLTGSEPISQTRLSVPLQSPSQPHSLQSLSPRPPDRQFSANYRSSGSAGPQNSPQFPARDHSTSTRTSGLPAHRTLQASNSSSPVHSGSKIRSLRPSGSGSTPKLDIKSQAGTEVNHSRAVSSVVTASREPANVNLFASMSSLSRQVSPRTTNNHPLPQTYHRPPFHGGIGRNVQNYSNIDHRAPNPSIIGTSGPGPPIGPRLPPNGNGRMRQDGPLPFTDRNRAKSRENGNYWSANDREKSDR